MKRCNHCFCEIQGQVNVCPACGYYDGQPAKELYHLFPGTELHSRYIVGQVLGFGGFGITYKAWDSKLETVVAIKEYYPSGLVNRVPGEQKVILFANNKSKVYQTGLERFLDEAKNMAKFSTHPNIVNIFEFFEQNNTAYIVMEFLDGTTLSDFLKDNTLDVAGSLEITQKICMALKEIHSQGIIHRDVSPDNIFMCMDGSVKLIDFGAARFSANEEQQMTIILKPGYAPPEQYEKISKQGPWTDIYALGATLYRMLTGEKPEESTNRKVNDSLQSPREMNAEVSENISNTVMKAMAIEQHMRFARVDDFLEGLVGKKTVLSVAAEKRKRKRRRLVGVLLAVLVLACGIGILGYNLMKQKASVELPDANISLAYQLSGDPQRDTAKQNALEQIAEVFMKSYPNVKVELIGVAPEGYLKNVSEMKTHSDGLTITLFESSGFSEDELDGISEDASAIARSDEADLCYSFDQYKSTFPQGKQIPLSFDAMVLYCNTTSASFDGDTITTLDELWSSDDTNHKIAVNSAVEDLFMSSFGSNGIIGEKVEIVNDPEAFVAGEYAYYFSITSEYSVIQSRLPARYRIIRIDAPSILAYYAETYSIKAGITENERKVSEAFLRFMLSDSAQDYLYIQNWTGILPLNKSVLEVWEMVYSDFDSYFDNMSNYDFRKR